MNQLTLSTTTPPQLLPAEKAVLGAMLANPQTIPQAMGLLQAEDFYDHSHQQLFTVLCRHYQDGGECDPLTISEKLPGGYQQHLLPLTQLASQVATTANLPAHAQLLKDKTCQRQAQQLAQQLAQALQDNPQEAASLARTYGRQLQQLTQPQTPQLVSFETILRAALIKLNTPNDPSRQCQGVDTGFYQLNELTDGLQKEDLIILAARPSVGKSALGLQVAIQAAAQDHAQVLFFSLEMSLEQLANRAIATHNQLNGLKVQKKKLSPTEFAQANQQTPKLFHLPIQFNAQPSLTIQALIGAAHQAHQQKPLNLIVIDYLQLLAHKAPGESENERIAYVSIELKNLARQLQVPILTLCQLNRQAEARPDKRPQLADLRGSGGIEQDADMVWLLYRPGMYGLKDKNGLGLDDQAQLIIAKQRNGPTGTLYLGWDNPTTRFTDPQNNLRQKAANLMPEPELANWNYPTGDPSDQ